MPKITIDGSEIEVEKGTTVIQAAERLGIEVPRYCYHPGLLLIRPVTMADINMALPYLRRLVFMLNHLRVLVLVGRKAQLAENHIDTLTDIPIVKSFHPSNLSINSSPTRRAEILASFRKANSYL